MDGTNRYAYAHDDPVGFTDPTGHMSKAEQEAQSDKDRHSTSRLTPDQIGDVYHKAADAPKDLEHTSQRSADTVLQQQRRLSQGEAQRAQTKPPPIITKEEKFEAAKAGGRNWLLDKAAAGIDQAVGLPSGHNLLAGPLLEPLRAPEPPEFPTTLRAHELKENYEAMQTTLTVAELGVTLVAPMVAESALASAASRAGGIAPVSSASGSVAEAGALELKAAASEGAAASTSSSPSGPWIRFSRSKAEANAFARTAEQIEGRLPLPSKKLGGGPQKWGSTFSNRPLQPGRPPELPSQLGPYREYTTLLPGATNRGGLRTVTGGSGEVFTTWTHYGEAQPFFPVDPLEPLPRPTFLRAR